jgi:oxygen-independent coproporphyrinogen-3 oxidase
VPGGIEITMEANPASADAGRFAGYRSAGVNRLSLGVQALNDNDLKFLGRLHSVDEALSAVNLARSTFPRLSFDLIYARPGQTAQSWADELERAIGHAADHLSLYQLTIEEGTPFKALHEAGKIIMPDDNDGADLYDLTQEITAAHGLPAYEVSNHAAPGAQSRHNLTYWRYGDYAGIGPGAHGRLTLADGQRIATETHRRPEDWMAAVGETGHGMTASNTLKPADGADEMLLMGLRLKEGLDLARLDAEFGWQPSPKRLQAMIDLGMIVRLGNTRIAATQKGMTLLNAVISELATA